MVAKGPEGDRHEDAIHRGQNEGNIGGEESRKETRGRDADGEGVEKERQRKVASSREAEVVKDGHGDGGSVAEAPKMESSLAIVESLGEGKENKHEQNHNGRIMLGRRGSTI